MPTHVSFPSTQSLYVEMRTSGLKIGSGTAFVAASSNGMCFLVTNRHVVTGRHQETDEPLDKKHAALPDELVVWHNSSRALGEYVEITVPLHVDGNPQWIEHPVLGRAADFVAFRLSEGPEVRLLPYRTEYLLHLRTQPAQRVSVVGFPFGERTGASFAVWATGFIASEPEINHGGRPVFLIDCRTREGQSGSPVIFHHNTGGTLTDESEIQVTTSTSWLLGIYSGRINAESDLGIVWKTYALAELLDYACTVPSAG